MGLCDDRIIIGHLKIMIQLINIQFTPSIRLSIFPFERFLNKGRTSKVHIYVTKLIGHEGEKTTHGRV